MSDICSYQGRREYGNLSLSRLHSYKEQNSLLPLCSGYFQWKAKICFLLQASIRPCRRQRHSPNPLLHFFHGAEDRGEGSVILILLLKRSSTLIWLSTRLVFCMYKGDLSDESLLQFLFEEQYLVHTLQ